MAISDLFQKDIPIGRIRDDELRKTRMDLQMARSQSRQNLEQLERQKQERWEKALNEKNKDLRRSFLTEVNTIGFRMQMERRMLETIEGQSRLVTVVEAVKDFQRRQIQTPLLRKLINVRLSDLDGAIQEIVRQGFVGDQVAHDIVQRWTAGFALEGSEDVQELERLIEQAQAEAGTDVDLKILAERVNQRHNELLEKRPLPA